MLASRKEKSVSWASTIKAPSRCEVLYQAATTHCVIAAHSRAPLSELALELKPLVKETAYHGHACKPRKE